jgi:DNA-binding NarL/FixJ family response regulator
MSEVQYFAVASVGRAEPSVRRPRAGRPANHPSTGNPAEGYPAAATTNLVPTRVYVYAKDTILRAGVASQLRRSPSVTLAEEYAADPDGVAVIVSDEIGDDVVSAIRAIRRSCTPKVVVIVSHLTRSSARAAVDAGAHAFLQRGEARPDRMVAAVRSVALAADPPTSLEEAAGELLDELPPEPSAPAPPPSALSDRDVQVLRLMAEGQSTAGIARDLAYSESTIKNIIHAIVRELGARNRAHAVATALRTQLI